MALRSERDGAREGFEEEGGGGCCGSWRRKGWKGTGYYACTLHVSERTIRRYVDRLCASGLLIHRRYGGYTADPSGNLLKRDPWLAW